MNANINFTIRNNTHGHMQLRRVKRPTGRRYGHASPLPHASHRLVIKTPKGSNRKVGTMGYPAIFPASSRVRGYGLISPRTAFVSIIAIFSSLFMGLSQGLFVLGA